MLLSEPLWSSVALQGTFASRHADRTKAAEKSFRALTEEIGLAITLQAQLIENKAPDEAIQAQTDRLEILTRRAKVLKEAAYLISRKSSSILYEQNA